MRHKLQSDLAQLLRLCLANGDRDEWEEFFQLAQPLVASAVLRSLSRVGRVNRELADDLIQETFLKLCGNGYRVLRSFRADDTNSLTVYLKTIATSIVMDHLRARLTLKEGSGKDVTALAEVEPFLSSRDTQFAELEQKMFIERVEKCLDVEEIRNRTMFWLYHRHGLTPKAISDLPEIKMSKSGVETAIYRLTKAVRQCLGRASVSRAAVSREGGQV